MKFSTTAKKHETLVMPRKNLKFQHYSKSTQNELIVLHNQPNEAPQNTIFCEFSTCFSIHFIKFIMEKIKLCKKVWKKYTQHNKFSYFCGVSIDNLFYYYFLI